MSAETKSGVVEAVRKDGKGFAIDDVWYSSWDALNINKGDSVVFTYVKKGQYNNIKGKVRTDGTGQPTGSASANLPKKDFNLGVEMGHASNLAMRMMEQYLQTTADTVEIGSTEYYKKFAGFTDNIYELMKRLKDSKANANEKEAQAATPKPEVKSEVSDEDIFG